MLLPAQQFVAPALLLAQRLHREGPPVVLRRVVRVLVVVVVADEVVDGVERPRRGGADRARAVDQAADAVARAFG